MPTLEEMTAWNCDEIEAEIRVTLPPGVEFDCGFDKEAGTWFVRFWRLQPDGTKNVLFQDWGFEQRITYFNGYGWVWARQQPKPPVYSPWRPRRQEVMPQRAPSKTAHVTVSREAVADPDDLVPEKIEAVYADLRGHPKKR